MGDFVEGEFPLVCDATFFQAHLLPLIKKLRSKHRVLPIVNRLAWGVVPQNHLKVEVHKVP
jgi:hypothetical protein